MLLRTYEWLRKHYHDKHYLCEEGNCINEQFTSVFRTSIDLQGKLILYYQQLIIILLKDTYKLFFLFYLMNKNSS